MMILKIVVLVVALIALENKYRKLNLSEFAKSTKTNNKVAYSIRIYNKCRNSYQKKQKKAKKLINSKQHRIIIMKWIIYKNKK